jgi:rubredoxin
MVILSTLANGHSADGEDPRAVFAERLGELDHLTVSFTDAEPPQVRLALPDLTLQCAVQAAPDGVREHLALRVDAVKPTSGHPEGAKVLTITARHPVVSADNGTVSDTFRLLDWRESSRRAAVSPQLYATLKLVDRLEGAEKQRAATQRTRFTAARESWRCRNCRALWRPDDHERCPSCGRVFTEADRRQPEVGKVEFTIPPEDPLNLQADAAVLVEPEDEPNFVGRVSRIDHHRRIVEVVCRTFEHAGTEGYITPSFNRALYQAKRSVLAAIATKDYGVGLLAQLLVAPRTLAPPLPDEIDGAGWLTDGMIPNAPQNRAVSLLSNCSAGQCVFIQGPPGTGKTTVIVEAVKRRLATDPEQRILVTSHSNLAVDNALERLAGTPGMRAVRVARAERVHPTVDQFRCDDEDDPRLLTANCYFATCATAATSGITDMNFDIVILDEANKARADEALPALRLGSAVAMVGDHKQLPPVEDDALYGIVETDPALEDLVNRSLFEQCWEGGLVDDAKCLLTVQHRMHPDISAYVSKASYDNQLEDAAEVRAYSFVTRKPFPVALHFVDTEGMKGSSERRGPGGALRNEAEVRIAAQVVRLLDERCPRDLSMAVIAMYAEQVERLRQALGRRKFKRPVKIDTVDSFEGREEDLVVISLVRSNERGRIGFLRVPNRLNVAISRARRLVACIGDSATLRAGEESMYGVLVEAARSTGGWLPASELVTPTKRTQAPRRRPAVPPVAAGGEGDVETPGRPARRRRRRGARRPGQQQQVTAAPGTEEQAAAAAGGPPAASEAGADGTPARRRRRRRRGRGTGTGAEAHPEAAAAATTEADGGGEVPEGGDATRARRRRRRRRSGRGGGAEGGAAAPAGAAPAAEAPSGGGGD